MPCRARPTGMTRPGLPTPVPSSPPSPSLARVAASSTTPPRRPAAFSTAPPPRPAAASSPRRSVHAAPCVALPPSRLRLRSSVHRVASSPTRRLLSSPRTFFHHRVDERNGGGGRGLAAHTTAVYAARAELGDGDALLLPPLWRSGLLPPQLLLGFWLPPSPSLPRQPPSTLAPIPPALRLPAVAGQWPHATAVLAGPAHRAEVAAQARPGMSCRAGTAHE